MKTGGLVKLIAYPNSIYQLSVLLSITSQTKTPMKVIGATSNLLFLDDASYNFLISTDRLNTLRVDRDSSLIVAGAGVQIPALSRAALYAEIDGFAGLEGIPGSVGGAAFMNAGAYGYEVQDTLLDADVVDYDGTIRRIEARKLELQHRNSAIRTGKLRAIIACCRFRGRPGDAAKIEAEMELYHAKRHRYQDFLYPNLGSIFSGSPYRALGQRDIYFKLAAAGFYLFCYRFRLFRRESPINRRWLNDIAVKRFNIDVQPQPFSTKTLNCLVNRGQGTANMVRYIELLNSLTGHSIPLENEIVPGF